MAKRSPTDWGTEGADTVRRVVQTVGSRIGLILAGAVLVVVLVKGTYEVGPGAQGVIRTFGKESCNARPCMHFSITFVQNVDVVNVEQIRRLEVGFRGDKTVASEALMLTGDENIVEAGLIVQYRVKDPSKYLFELKDPDESLRATAEVALRSMVGRTNIDEVITTGRENVQNETREWLQTLMDSYNSGLSITEVKLQTVDAPDEVKEAFHDVVRAREEKEKLINQAKGYLADLIPRARGEARQIEREAEAYREERVLRARGDASKFDAQLTEYRKAEAVTRQRLYLETVERILARVPQKTLIDSDVGRGAVPVLQLTNAAAAVAGGAK